MLRYTLPVRVRYNCIYFLCLNNRKELRGVKKLYTSVKKMDSINKLVNF